MMRKKANMALMAIVLLVSCSTANERSLFFQKSKDMSGQGISIGYESLPEPIKRYIDERHEIDGRYLDQIYRADTDNNQIEEYILLIHEVLGGSNLYIFEGDETKPIVTEECWGKSWWQKMSLERLVDENEMEVVLETPVSSGYFLEIYKKKGKALDRVFRKTLFYDDYENQKMEVNYICASGTQLPLSINVYRGKILSGEKKWFKTITSSEIGFQYKGTASRIVTLLKTSPTEGGVSFHILPTS